MADKKNDLLQGTLDLLILRTLLAEPMHGFEIAKRIEQVSGDLLRVEHGSLYPALYRLEEKGFVKARWGVSKNNRKVKYYTLTRSGRRRLDGEVLGRTPVIHRRAPGAGTGRLELRRDGHEPYAQDLAFDVSQRVFVKMTALPTPSAPAAMPAPSTPPPPVATPRRVEPPAPTAPKPKPKPGIYKL